MAVSTLFTLIGRYIFDEFHPYNVKQLSDIALLLMQTIAPTYERASLFASAAPD